MRSVERRETVEGWSIVPTSVDMASPVLAAARILLGTVLVFAALSKARSPQRLAQELRNYSVPRGAVRALALAIIGAELSLGIGLLARLAVPIIEYAAFSLIALFMVAVTWRWIRTGSFDCGCFGSSTPERRWLVFPRNVALLTCALAAARDQTSWTPTAVLSGGVLALTMLLVVPALLAATEPHLEEALQWTG